MKHAFLIIAHGNWEQLYCLLKQLDNKNNDIYIHIDKKVSNVPVNDIKSKIKYGNIKILSKYKVYWGSFELVLTEMYLLNKATKTKHDYYHLLSGMDLLIKPMDRFYEFFKKNNGKEFIHYDSNERLKTDKEILRRVKLYHFFVNNRKKYKINILNKMFTLLSRTLLFVQEILNINRQKKNKYIFKYGSQWFSITDACARYILKNEKNIKKIFYRTKCADELFIQTIIYNSEFEKKLYNRQYDDSEDGNMRHIDIKIRGKNGSPYTWRIDDFKELDNSKCLIARKFDINVDKKIVEKILENTEGK